MSADDSAAARAIVGDHPAPRNVSAEDLAAARAAARAIVTDRLVLRPLQPKDLPAFAAYRADPDVARLQGWDPSYSLADAERLLADQEGVELGAPGGGLQLAVAQRADDALLGDCYVRIGSSQPATAELGVTLAPASQGRGIATEAVAALLATLFTRHGIHRVFAEADDRNDAVHLLFERLGFRCEARLVEADWFKGEWTTLRIYALLAREWRAQRLGGRGSPRARAMPPER